MVVASGLLRHGCCVMVVASGVLLLFHMTRMLGHGSLRAAAAGIEPTSGRLTAAFPYQHGSQRNRSPGQDGWI